MAITTGYKATDKDMKCRDVQFALGEWQEVEGELVECENGLHFCTELAHTYEFYNSETDRRFECEVEEVLEVEHQPGVKSKRVARRIKLTKELTNTGDSNTGHRNTGNSNTGDWNQCNYSSGFFGSIDLKVMSFDLPTDYSQPEFRDNFSDLIYNLGEKLLLNDPIDVEPFLEIPNITQERLDNLHQKFIKSRQAI